MITVFIIIAWVVYFAVYATEADDACRFVAREQFFHVALLSYL